MVGALARSTHVARTERSAIRDPLYRMARIPLRSVRATGCCGCRARLALPGTRSGLGRPKRSGIPNPHIYSYIAAHKLACCDAPKRPCCASDPDTQKTEFHEQEQRKDLEYQDLEY